MTSSINPITCPCQNEDARQAYGAINQINADVHLAVLSHLDVSVVRCECGQNWLRIFTKLIMVGSNLDDDQASMCVPITRDEAAFLKNLARDVRSDQIVGDFRKMSLNRRYLRFIHPADEEASWDWFTGPLIILPYQ